LLLMGYGPDDFQSTYLYSFNIRSIHFEFSLYDTNSLNHVFVEENWNYVVSQEIRWCNLVVNLYNQM
jgi:hypothetical protein